MATQASPISFSAFGLSTFLPRIRFFCLLQVWDQWLFLVPNKYEIISSLPQVHTKSKRTKVLVCSLMRPVSEQCPLGSVCHQKLLLGQTQTHSSPAITTWDAWKQKQTASRLCSASGGIQKEQYDGTREVMRGWHWRQSPTQSWGKILQQEAIALSIGQEINWKRSERVNRVLGTDSACNRHSVNNVSYLENLVKEIKRGLF